ncbi:hypothetical protein BZL30_9013 [Mycobacterium kansasii]|uniref:Uncharacterized protein n=1 Tax=Mycobacterium kansasii TaxID=1768 RepID=A0A1V3WDE5_MYCKA|nr:hypothetical protein BZL30_9013 [Mycobacterium kansasii]
MVATDVGPARRHGRRNGSALVRGRAQCSCEPGLRPGNDQRSPPPTQGGRRVPRSVRVGGSPISVIARQMDTIRDQFIVEVSTP